MAIEQAEQAISRIEAALARIEAAAERIPRGDSGDAALATRHERLRGEVRLALRQMDQLIGGSSSAAVQASAAMPVAGDGLQ